MTFEEFDTLTESIFKDVREMRDTKGKEYANSDNRFANFDRLASRMDLPREVVWLVYFTKHMDAIESFIRHRRTYSTEHIQGRITDAITYLTLLAGMIKESESVICDRIGGCLKVNCNNPNAACKCDPQGKD